MLGATFLRSVVALAAAVAVIPASALAALHSPAAFSSRHASGRSWMSPQAKTASTLVYVSCPSAQNVDVFQLSGSTATLVGQIATVYGPEMGLTTDAAGNVYTTEYFNEAVAVYPKGGTTPSLVLNDAGWMPFAVAVGSDGTVFVANQTSFSNGPGSVTVFPPGSTNPSATLTDPNFYLVDGVFVDGKQNVYAAYDLSGQQQSHGRVAFFPHGSSAPVETGIQIDYAGGIGEDAADNLLVVNSLGQSLDAFNEKTFATGATLPIDGVLNFATLDRKGTTLYVTNETNHDVEMYSFPGGTLLGSFADPNWSSTRYPLGIAITPRGPH